MRQIKFRGKSIKTGKMVYGSFDDNWSGIGQYWIYEIKGRKIIGHEVDPETIGQNTGHTNVLGLELYEGDIVEYESDNGIVRAKVIYKEADSEGLLISGFHYEVISTRDFPDDNSYGFKIIGNIYENSELLQP